MDRIRKALDRARDERETQVASVPPQVASVPAQVAVHPVAATARPAAPRYTHTAVFTPVQALLEQRCVLAQGAEGPAAAAFRLLRTQVLQRMTEHGFQTLAVVSPRAADGRTVTAANLAVQVAADRHHTALLVDYDLRSPGIAPAFGLAAERGVGEVLAGAAEVADCLQHPSGFERLVIFPAVTGSHSAVEPLAGPRSRSLIAELRSRYRERIVVFDLPPVLESDVAVALAPHIDCALLVVAEGRTARADITRVLQLLRKTTIVGTVLNRATELPVLRR
jgi:Mrp family chromosome partitioning ATPase